MKLDDVLMLAKAGYSKTEIAALLGRKPATVRSQLARGRALLRDVWKGAEDV